MNQECIGKFIASCRKEQKLTQEELAEKLGITAKAVSKWECGKGLPDPSIMLELCKILKITVNDLLSGERVSKENYQDKLEQNIIDTIDYSNRKVSEQNKTISKILLFFGFCLTFLAFFIFPSDSSWGGIYSLIGLVISLIGFIRLNKKLSYLKRIFLSFGYFLLGIIVLLIVDYSNVVLNKVAPRFSYLKETGDSMIVYKALFYNVYRINRNTKNEYYIIDTKKQYREDNIPVTPFNRDKSGIDNIIKYKNKYVGNNSNDSHLIDNWYVNENKYLEKSLLYNSVSIFYLIDNVQYITFNFSGNSYTVSRDKVKELYPNFNDIVTKNNFNNYLENKMNDNDFVQDMFKRIFID